MLEGDEETQADLLGSELGKILGKDNVDQNELDALLESITDLETRQLVNDALNTLADGGSIEIHYADGTVETIQRFDPELN